MYDHPNLCLIRIHCSYSVEEVARLLNRHKSNVRTWIREGLSTIDGRRPTLIHGLDLKNFLRKRRQSTKQTCPPGHFFCVKCRAPRPPADGRAEYLPLTSASGMLRAICPDCGILMHRRACLSNLNSFSNLQIEYPQGGSRIIDCEPPFLSSDSEMKAHAHEDVQPEE
jgi:hypothetical protein